MRLRLLCPAGSFVRVGSNSRIVLDWRWRMSGRRGGREFDIARDWCIHQNWWCRRRRDGVDCSGRGKGSVVIGRADRRRGRAIERRCIVVVVSWGTL